jgi:hypothetical protein
MTEQLKEKLKNWKGKCHLIVWTVFWCVALFFPVIHMQALLGTEEERSVLSVLAFIGILAAVAFSACFCARRWLMQKRPERKEDKKNIRFWHFLALAANSVYAFWIMESVNNEDLGKMEFGYMALNVLGIFIISMIFLFWFNSFRRTMLAVVILFTVMSLIFYYVYLCRGEPLQLIDFFSFSTAMDVAGNYEFVMTPAIVAAVPLSLCLIGIYMHSPDWMVFRKKPGRILMRAGVAVFMFFGYFFYLNVNWNGGLGILTDLWAPIKTYHEYGTTVGFFCVAKYMRLTPPDGYSVEKTEQIAESADTGGDADSGKTKPVNIIAIMNEAWADYSLLGDLQTNEDPMPYYHSMEENTIKGNTLVCIRGGGTAKTEYEFLTGNSVKRFPGMVPYVSYYTHDQYSLVTTLEAQGYETAAMHPNKGSNWKRTSAYRLLDFDRFYTIDDFDDDAEKLRGHITDRANYEKIIEVINSKEDSSQPFFLFDVTMQNHGGYTGNSYNGDIELTGEYQDESVERYLSLSRETDEALEYLIEYFKAYEEPTIIVMFGDHYPDLPDEFTESLSGAPYDELTLDEQEMYYATPFFIWANFDIDEAEDVLTSTNYLGTLMLEQTGLEMAPYNEYLQDLMEVMPALNHLGYMDASGKFHSWSDGDPDILQKEWEYECLQYNNLAEDSRRIDWFFTVEPQEGG